MTASWKQFGIFVFVLLLSVMLAACGGDAADPSPSASADTHGGKSPSNQGSESPVVQPRTEPVELAYYNSNNYPEERIMSEWGSKVLEKFPHVSLNSFMGT